MSKELNFQVVRERLHQNGRLSHDAIKDFSDFFDRESLLQFSVTSLTCGRYKLAHFHSAPKDFKRKRAWLFHGLFDHSLYMLRIAEILISLDYEVHMLDLPGHGLSLGERARIDDFSEYGKILGELATAEDLFVGFSTGCVAWLSCMICERSFLIAPLIQSRAFRWTVPAVALMRSLGREKVSRRSSTPSHDHEFLKWRKLDPMAPEAIDLVWCESLIRWNHQVVRNWERENSRLPLICYGTNDQTLDTRVGAKVLERRFDTKVK